MAQGASFPETNCWKTRIRLRRETGCRRFRCAALPTPRASAWGRCTAISRRRTKLTTATIQLGALPSTRSTSASATSTRRSGSLTIAARCTRACARPLRTSANAGCAGHRCASRRREGRRAPARVPADRAHPRRPRARSTSTMPESRPICPTGSMQKACAGSSSRTSWAASLSPKRRLQSAVWPARTHVVRKQRTVARGNEHHAFDVHTAEDLNMNRVKANAPIGRCPQTHSILEV